MFDRQTTYIHKEKRNYYIQFIMGIIRILIYRNNISNIQYYILTNNIRDCKTMNILLSQMRCLRDILER